VLQKLPAERSGATSCYRLRTPGEAANHGLTALDAISNALAGNPWLPATQPAIPIARELKPRPEPAVAWLPATPPAIPAAA